jgi:flagellin
VLGGGTELTGNSVNLNNTAVTFLSGNANASQTFSFNIATAQGNTPLAVQVNGSLAGITGADVITQLNSALSTYGITASIASDGDLEFGGNTAFSVSAGAIAGGGTASTVAATAASVAFNTSLYSVDSATANNATATPGGVFADFTAGGTGSETIAFQNGQGTTTVTLSGAANGGLGNATTIAQALQTLNTALQNTGISAVENAASDGISFQSSSSFNIDLTANSTGGAGNLFGSGSAGSANADVGAVVVTAPSSASSNTGNALSAITAINSALSQLGDVQSRVGAGEMLLQYATDLANSQITNFSAAESRIRDADVATEAANLSKAQVLEQSSVAAMAQANSAPQALLKLLQ